MEVKLAASSIAGHGSSKERKRVLKKKGSEAEMQENRGRIDEEAEGTAVLPAL